MPFRPGFPLLALACVAALAACSGEGRRGPRDSFDRSGNGDVARVDGADAGVTPVGTATVHSVATASPPGVKPRIVARANALAIATTKTHVYFGDAEDDWMFALAKQDGAQPERFAQHAAVSGALVADEKALTWIATPGDAVLRAPLDASTPPITIREREIFTGVAAQGGDVFLAGAEAGKGALTRITGSTAARLATLDAVPRALFVDATNAFVVMPASIVRTPRQRGPVTTLALGEGFSRAATDDACVYVTVRRASSRTIMRVPKYGGATIVTSSIDGVRDAPIAVRRGEIFYFDAERPALRALAIDTNASRIVSEDPIFDRVNALAVDDEGAWVATGEASSGAVVQVPLR